jgi:hypothetical protein
MRLFEIQIRDPFVLPLEFEFVSLLILLQRASARR